MDTPAYRHNVSIESIILAVALLLGATTTPVSADLLDHLDYADQWQANRLFQPTHNQRKQEGKGQIMIYDGLKDVTINMALDRHFDRIQNMMFTRIIKTDKSGQPLRGDDGEVEIEDDGC